MESLYIYLATIVSGLATLALILGILLILKKRAGEKDTAVEPAQNGEGAFKKWMEKLNFGGKVFWNIAVISSGLAIFYYLGLESKATPADIGNQVWNHWQQILLAWSMLAFLVWLNLDEKKALPLQKTLAWIVSLFLIVLPIWSSYASTPQSGVKIGTGCMVPFTDSAFTEHPAWTEKTGYTARNKWLSLQILPGENSCLVQNPGDGHIEWDADNPSIHTLEVKCVYGGGGTGSVRTDGCKAEAVTAGYVHNPTNAPVTVWYAYVKNSPST